MLTFQYISFRKISGLKGHEKINYILNRLKENKILILEGRLKSHEEIELIQETMKDLSVDFNKYDFVSAGIEIGVLYNTDSSTTLRHKIVDWLEGDRKGITIIGPANIVDNLKQYPEHIHMALQKDFLKRHLRKK